MMQASANVVLVVDDDIDVREGLKALWSSVGLRCEGSPRPENFYGARPPTQWVAWCSTCVCPA